jgi:hypothetical protein
MGQSLSGNRPSGSDRAELLSYKEPVFRSVEESVRSIVPTNLSLCSDDASSVRSFESSELMYAPFSFENDLFTSYVYKRNFRVTRLYIKQVQQVPVVKHTNARIQTSTAYRENVSMDTESRPSIDMDTDRHSFASRPWSFTDHTQVTERVEVPLSTVTPAQDVYQHALETNIVTDNKVSVPIKSGRVESAPVTEPRQLLVDSHPHIPGLYLETDSVEAINTVIGIKRKPLPSTKNSTNTSPHSSHLAKQIDEPASWCDETRSFEYGTEDDITIAEAEQRSLSRLKPLDLEATNEWDSMLCLPARAIATPDNTLALNVLYNQNRPLFGTIMQVLGFMRGAKFMAEISEALMLSSNQIANIADARLPEGALLQSGWTSIILNDRSIASAAEFRDLANSSGILNHIPTALQLACAAKKAIVVEYLLSLGRPLLPLDWTVHPFILAAKRRCKPILELFLKMAKDTVSPLIINLALAMVVNQDCALSEDWLDAAQNDHKRLGVDVDIVTFLLTNGASPNAKDQNGISILSMAFRAAYSLNPFSMQIIDVLLWRGAYFGRPEQAIMFAGPPNAFESLKRRHKLVAGSNFKETTCFTYSDGSVLNDQDILALSTEERRRCIGHIPFLY